LKYRNIYKALFFNEEMVYVLYEKSRIREFSAIKPLNGRYFEINSNEAEKIKNAVSKDGWLALTIRNHLPNDLCNSVEISEKDAISLNGAALGLILAATKNPQKAQADLDAILKGEETERKYSKI
jgi:hypothetical protein